MKQTIFLHMEKAYDIALKTMNPPPKRMIKIVPTGFNHIRPFSWAKILEHHIYTFVEEKTNQKCNNFGKVPYDWRGEPPSIFNL